MQINQTRNLVGFASGSKPCEAHKVKGRLLLTTKKTSTNQRWRIFSEAWPYSLPLRLTASLAFLKPIFILITGRQVIGFEMCYHSPVVFALISFFCLRISSIASWECFLISVKLVSLRSELVTRTAVLVAFAVQLRNVFSYLALLTICFILPISSALYS